MAAAAQLQKATFDSSIYDVDTMELAMGIILSADPSNGITTEQRWEKETPYLGNLITKHTGLSEKSLLLDYGCGVGRLSKDAIQRSGCNVVGVDYSANMRAFAASYVDSPRFMACDEYMLNNFVGSGKCDAAIAVWVLQHCLKPAESIETIRYALKPGGKLFVLNDMRFVPTREFGFINDKVDVTAILDNVFKLETKIELDSALVLDLLVKRGAHCAVYVKE